MQPAIAIDDRDVAYPTIDLLKVREITGEFSWHGIVNPNDLELLRGVLDEHCVKMRIPDGPDREHCATRLMLMFNGGERDRDILLTELSRSSKYRVPEPSVSGLVGRSKQEVSPWTSNRTPQNSNAYRRASSKETGVSEAGLRADRDDRDGPIIAYPRIEIIKTSGADPPPGLIA
jgi:hypothetical protein